MRNFNKISFLMFHTYLAKFKVYLHCFGCPCPNTCNVMIIKYGRNLRQHHVVTGNNYFYQFQQYSGS